MSEAIGSLCIVLHGHLPYVLHHGSHPHGEAWLYEGAAETYLPLLDLISDVVQLGGKPTLTIGLTPVLLEQLAHARFKSGFTAYLKDRIQRAESDRREFDSKIAAQDARLSERWARWYTQKLDHFEHIQRDIPRQFAQHARDGHIQILTSNATHAYTPLLLNDEMIKAQLACGAMTTRKHLGIQARGMWLPECAYRPHEQQWLPAVLYDNPRDRRGLELFMANAGLTHFFVDSHHITGGQPLGVVENARFSAMPEAMLHWDHQRGWRSPLEPVGVASEPQPPRCFAFARHPRVSEQVWSSKIGYPASGEYLEFHRKHGEGGLRYFRITSPQLPLSAKQPYVPQNIDSPISGHSQHFCDIIRQTLSEYHAQTARRGVVVASFDAELFGHWWFEGPRFLREVIRLMNQSPDVELLTAEQALERHPPDKVMRLPEGSWGENGNHSVWLNGQTRWMWEIEYRAEGRMLKLLHALPWQTNEPCRAMLVRAARQLLLLQASDWPFVVHSKGAVDYGIQRFSGHATRFDRMTALAEKLAGGGTIDAIEQTQIAEADAHDDIFREIDLNWWM